jgi:hypothetical protein
MGKCHCPWAGRLAVGPLGAIPAAKAASRWNETRPGSNRHRLLSKACLSCLTGLQKGHNSADAQEIATARKIEDNW